MTPETEEKASNRLKTSTLAGAGREGANVRFGSKADMCSAIADVRFSPNSDRKSRHAASSDPAGDEQTAKRH